MRLINDIGEDILTGWNVKCKMDIGVCGFGYSGSGAMVDLLKEYDELCFADQCELFITYFPDGLIDLYHNTCCYHSKFFSADVAVKRFLSLCKNYGRLYGWNSRKSREFNKIACDFIKQVTNFQYCGYWAYDLLRMSELEKTWYFRIGSRVNKLLNREIIKQNKTIYFAYNPHDFEEHAKDFVSHLKELCGYSTVNNCVFNQPFAADNPEASFKFFDSPKAILVTRDPRDVYIMVKHYIGSGASWIPYENVLDYIEFYKCQCSTAHNRENVFVVRFEDLIYQYESTVTGIESFLQIKNHSNRGLYFEPEQSVNNTRLFEKHTEYADDIMIIEKELKEFLYPFEGVQKIDNTGECFWD